MHMEVTGRHWASSSIHLPLTPLRQGLLTDPRAQLQLASELRNPPVFTLQGWVMVQAAMPVFARTANTLPHEPFFQPYTCFFVDQENSYLMKGEGASMWMKITRSLTDVSHSSMNMFFFLSSRERTLRIQRKGAKTMTDSTAGVHSILYWIFLGPEP